MSDGHSPTFWPGDVPGGVPGFTDREETGPTGAGTPHARMEWFWERMRDHEELVGHLTGYHSLRSDYRFEAAIGDAFDRLAEEYAVRPKTHACPECGREWAGPGGCYRGDDGTYHQFAECIPLGENK